MAGNRAVADANDRIVNWAAFGQSRAELGADFVRILGYFREDGVKAVIAIEDAMRAHDAARLVTPSHMLKGEALQFGAETLAALAEHIEMVARRCVESHDAPDELLEAVVRLRPLLEETFDLFDRETNPLKPRKAMALSHGVMPAQPPTMMASPAPASASGGFGRKVPLGSGFGAR